MGTENNKFTSRNLEFNLSLEVANEMALTIMIMDYIGQTHPFTHTKSNAVNETIAALERKIYNQIDAIPEEEAKTLSPLIRLFTLACFMREL